MFTVSFMFLVPSNIQIYIVNRSCKVFKKDYDVNVDNKVELKATIDWLIDWLIEEYD